MTGSESRWITTEAPDSNVVKTALFTTPEGSKDYLVKISQGPRTSAIVPGSRWRIRFTPAEAVLGPLPPACVIRSSRIRPGQAVRIQCARVPLGSRLEIRWYRRTSRDGRYKRLASRWVTKGKADEVRTSSKGRRRGSYRVSVWLGKTSLGSRTLHIRPPDTTCNAKIRHDRTVPPALAGRLDTAGLGGRWQRRRLITAAGIDRRRGLEALPRITTNTMGFGPAGVGPAGGASSRRARLWVKAALPVADRSPVLLLEAGRRAR